MKRPWSEQPTKVLLGDNGPEIGANTLVLGRVDLQRLMLVRHFTFHRTPMTELSSHRRTTTTLPASTPKLAVCATKNHRRHIDSKVPNADSNNSSSTRQGTAIQTARSKETHARTTHQRGGQEEVESVASSGRTATPTTKRDDTSRLPSVQSSQRQRKVSMSRRGSHERSTGEEGGREKC